MDSGEGKEDKSKNSPDNFLSSSHIRNSPDGRSRGRGRRWREKLVKYFLSIHDTHW